MVNTLPLRYAAYLPFVVSAILSVLALTGDSPALFLAFLPMCFLGLAEVIVRQQRMIDTLSNRSGSNDTQQANPGDASGAADS